MTLRIALSSFFTNVDPSLPVVQLHQPLPRAYDVTIFHTSEDDAWVWSNHRLLRPMFLSNEDECRRALAYFTGKPTGPTH